MSIKLLTRFLMKFFVITVVLNLYLDAAIAITTTSKITYASYCQVFDESLVLLKKFPGNFCHFFSDGTFVSGNEKHLTYYETDSKVRWQLPMHVHHQINVNKKNEILILSSEIEFIKSQKVRFDKLFIINQQGKILKSWSFFENQNKLPRPGSTTENPFIKTNWFALIFPDVEYEFSHANSFYEILSNASFPKIDAFRKGNYIVNSKFSTIFILDKNLNTILWKKNYPSSGLSILHDVQVLKNGNLLIYNNAYDLKKRISTIDEYDPKVNRVVWQYGLRKEEQFFSEYAGGVQLLPNKNILFSDIGIGVNEVFKQAHVMIIDQHRTLIMKKELRAFDLPVQPIQVKQLDLRSFFKRNKSL